MHVPIWAWAAFVVALVALLVVDLLAHRRAHVIRLREAALWSALWVSLGIGFAFVIWAWQGPEAAGQYTAAWLLEKSLSVDNLFVFASDLRLLQGCRGSTSTGCCSTACWGALVLRFAFIAAGMALLNAVHVVIYLFGAFLVYTAIKMVRGTAVDMDPGQSRAVRLLRRVLPVTERYEGQRVPGCAGVASLMATPLLAVLVAVETADVLFAFDSVPAALGVTDQTFLVYTANALGHPGAAVAVLPPLRGARPVPPPGHRPGGDPRVHRREDAAHRRVCTSRSASRSARSASCSPRRSSGRW